MPREALANSSQALNLPALRNITVFFSSFSSEEKMSLR